MGGRARMAAWTVSMAMFAVACGGAGDDATADADGEVGASSTTTEAPTTTSAPTTTEAAGEEVVEPEVDTDGDDVLDGDDAFPDDPRETAPIVARFPIVDGVVELPESEPSVQMLGQVVDLLLAEELELDAFMALLTPGLFPEADVAAVLDVTRAGLSDEWAVIDVRAVTPWWLWVQMGIPGSTAGRGVVRLGLDPNTGLINELSLSPLPIALGEQVRPEATGPTMQAVLETMVGRSEFVGGVVAEITDTGCRALAGVNEGQPLATASVFKTWVLGAAARQIAAGELTADATVSFVPGEFMVGGSRASAQFAAPFELSVQTTADLMMGLSDNGATDMLERLVGREALDAFVADSGMADPSLLIPMLGVRELDHLYSSVPQAQVDAFVAAGDDEQRQILDEVVQPLGANGLGQFGNDGILDFSWNASPLDVCEVMRTMRDDHQNDSPAAAFIDQAFGAEGYLFDYRDEWDRVWYKGGGIPGREPDTGMVLTSATMVESAEHGAFAVIMMLNDSEGVPNGTIPFDMASWNARVQELLIRDR